MKVNQKQSSTKLWKNFIIDFFLPYLQFVFYEVVYAQWY